VVVVGLVGGVVGLVGGVVGVVVVGFVVPEVSGRVPPSPNVVVVVMVVVQATTDTHVVTSTRSAPIDRFVCMLRLSLLSSRSLRRRDPGATSAPEPIDPNCRKKKAH
jgi:hypothetical protein